MHLGQVGTDVIEIGDLARRRRVDLHVGLFDERERMALEDGIALIHGDLPHDARCAAR